MYLCISLCVCACVSVSSYNQYFLGRHSRCHGAGSGCGCVPSMSEASLAADGVRGNIEMMIIINMVMIIMIMMMMVMMMMMIIIIISGNHRFFPPDIH